MERYDCDQCGSCCNGHLLVEAYELDALREPRLLSAEVRVSMQELLAQDLMCELENEGRCLVISGGPDKPCKFLDSDNRCAIYPTRPNVCVGMLPGDRQCQEARSAEGLSPLKPAER